jgi:hypothetical protein
VTVGVWVGDCVGLGVIVGVGVGAMHTPSMHPYRHFIRLVQLQFASWYAFVLAL